METEIALSSTDVELKKIRSSIDALSIAISLRDVRCDRHNEIFKEQQKINERHDEQIAKLQENGFGIQQLVVQLGEELKADRQQNTGALQSMAVALERAESFQNERHEKSLEVQRQSLTANLSLLKIFQDHKGEAQKTFEEIERKIITQSISYKAFVGLGMGIIFLVTVLVSTYIFPAIDKALHTALKAFLTAMPTMW